MDIVHDRMTALTTENLKLIHEKTIEILSDTGIWFQSASARAIFKDHGFKVKEETVFFTEKDIQKALKTIPVKFKVVARNPNRTLEIGGNSITFGPSGGSPFILDYDGILRKGTSKDCQDSIKIAHSLEDFGFNRGLTTSEGDIHPQNVQLYQLLTAMKLTDKPLDCPTPDGIDLLSILFGISKKKMHEDAIQGKAYALSYINPISPLGLSEHESDRLVALCQYGVALGISPMPMAGMTAPCTLPGLLVSQNCEILGTMVLAQLVNPGCPLLYGCIGTITDMRHVSGPIGAPESRIIESASAQLAGFYGLPTRGDAGLTDSNSVDFQAGSESTLHFVNAVRSGINLLPGLGAMGSWNVGSLEKLVLDAEIAGYTKRLLRPLEFTEETLAVDLIKKVGQRGAFISEEHTYNHFRTEFYDPMVFLRTPYDLWKQEGGKEARDSAHNKVLEILENYKQPYLGKSLEIDLDKYAREHYPVLV
ncbi:MAG TPA: trimethylamine methyltransferase family protein [Desulfosporosinus sp.]|nr:trimethylamine methyltransferase family protein [Desulfosporosinus sp.]